MKGQPFVKNGKTLLSGVDPVRRAERAADVVAITGRTLYLCPSPLYGYGLERFLSRLEEQEPNSAVLCIEADPELYELSAENISSSVAHNSRLHLAKSCDKPELAAFVRDTYGAAAFRRIEMLRLTGGYQLFPELYDSLLDMLRGEMATDWSNTLTLTKLGRLYIRNFFRNLALESSPHEPRCPSIANLSFEDAPVLVLGAGPSLDEILDQLKENDVSSANRTFKIVCVDTCVGALKDRGITPDLVVILESQHWNLRDFSGCRGWRAPAAVDLSALPSSVRVLDGDKYFFFTPWTDLRVFERLKEADLLPPSMPPLGSVGLTAVALAHRLTRGKIICSGLDFSFTQDKYHARGTPGHRRRLNTQTRFRGVENTAAFASGVFPAISKSGAIVYCNPIMKNYRDLFEREFAGDQRLFDIEGSGLPLGVKTLSMNEAAGILNIRNFYHELVPSVQTRTDTNRSCDIEQQVREVSGKEIKLKLFLENEKRRLTELRNMLSGEIEADRQRLEVLIDELDYLWVHFPDCAGGRRQEITDVSFLKRVRAEIDPMLKALD